MATIIEMQEGKFHHLSDYAEKVLKYGGKLMQCLEELEGKSRFDEYRGLEPKRPTDYRRSGKDFWEDDMYRGRYY